MRAVIDGGHLYLAKPPLFELVKQGRKSSDFVYSEKELEDALAKAIADRKTNDKPDLDNPEAFKRAGFVELKRYKGLGEMNAEQLWETTMNPENRVLIQVKTEDGEKADAIFTKLMGTEVELRKNFIQTHAKFVKDLDV